MQPANPFSMWILRWGSDSGEKEVSEAGVETWKRAGTDWRKTDLLAGWEESGTLGRSYQYSWDRRGTPISSIDILWIHSKGLLYWFRVISSFTLYEYMHALFILVNYAIGSFKTSFLYISYLCSIAFTYDIPEKSNYFRSVCRLGAIQYWIWILRK